METLLIIVIEKLIFIDKNVSPANWRSIYWGSGTISPNSFPSACNNIENINPNKSMINELKCFIERKLNYFADTNLNIQSKLEAKLSGFKDEIILIKKAINMGDANEAHNCQHNFIDLIVKSNKQKGKIGRYYDNAKKLDKSKRSKINRNSSLNKTWKSRMSSNTFKSTNQKLVNWGKIKVMKNINLR